MATEAVYNLGDSTALTAVKLTPSVISRTAEVPWVNHFVAQEAREYYSYG